LKTDQDRIGVAEQAAKDELQATEATSRAGKMCFGPPSGSPATAMPHISRPDRPWRRRFNDALLEAVHIKDRRIGRAEFSEVLSLSPLARVRTGP
jgi:hypothetical protein